MGKAFSGRQVHEVLGQPVRWGLDPRHPSRQQGREGPSVWGNHETDAEMSFWGQGTEDSGAHQ